MNYGNLLARRTKRMHVNAIREILKVASQPGMISLAGGYLDRRLPGIIDLYRPRKTAIINALTQYFPDGYRWSRPEGGMFVGVEGPEGMDMLRIYTQAVENGVAYVPGQFFFVEKTRAAIPCVSISPWPTAPRSTKPSPCSPMPCGAMDKAHSVKKGIAVHGKAAGDWRPQA